MSLRKISKEQPENFELTNENLESAKKNVADLEFVTLKLWLSIISLAK